MIIVNPEADYDCIFVELEDDNSRVQMHLHAQAGVRDFARREVRQIEVVSNSGTIFALDNVREKMPCDPHGLGEGNVYSGFDFGGDEQEEAAARDEPD